tara:strand:- start:32 stop:1042 length:1011 start_codon:yes stop_codon:yes gene_type:complete
MLDELIFFMLMAVGVTYLDNGGPYASNYGCPAYCAVHHKHVAFKDTLVVISDMAKNNNKSMLGGFLNYMSGRLGTEIDSLPSGERSLDNLKEMSSFMDTYQEAKQAQAVAVADMRNEGMDVDILPRSDLAFKQAEAVSTNADRLVDEVNLNFNQDEFHLTNAINEVNALFGGNAGGAKLSDASEFMKRVAATESKYGKMKLGDYSFGAFQVDPMRYIDIVDRSKTGAAKERMDLANQFLQDKLGDDSFDLRTALDVSSTRDDKGYVTSAKYNPNETLRTHNPYIAATLARLGLASVPEAIPSDLGKQADYWKKYWNTAAGAGTQDHFLRMVKAHTR